MLRSPPLLGLLSALGVRAHVGESLTAGILSRQSFSGVAGFIGKVHPAWRRAAPFQECRGGTRKETVTGPAASSRSLSNRAIHFQRV